MRKNKWFNVSNLPIVVVGVFVGWLIGLGISWLNVFGHSDNAPLICAMAGGIAAISRLLRQQSKLRKSDNA